MNYFDFYDLPVALELDLAALKKLYFNKSRLYHPDHHEGSSADVKAEMEGMSATNSRAYEVLGDFDQRLKHVVEILSGGNIELPQLSPMFLMEMMEINESVEGMGESQKEQLRADIMERDKKSWVALGDLVDRDLTTVSEDEIKQIKAYYFERKYLLRILENLDNLASL